MADRRASGGRIANVSGAVSLDGAQPSAGAELAALLDRCFEDVLVVGAAPIPGAAGRFVRTPRASAVDRLVAALAAAECERVIVVSDNRGAVPLALLLALSVWPEHDAVAPRRGTAVPTCAIYRRLAVLEAARAASARGDSLERLLALLDTAWIEGEDLDAVDPVEGAGARS